MSGTSKRTQLITLRLPVEVLEIAASRAKKQNQYKLYQNTRDYLEEILIWNITRKHRSTK